MSENFVPYTTPFFFICQICFKPCLTKRVIASKEDETEPMLVNITCVHCGQGDDILVNSLRYEQNMNVN